MTGKEAIDALLRRRRGSRAGLYDIVWGETPGEWVRQGYPVDPDSGRPVDPAAHFGHDMENAGGWFDWAPRRGCREVLAETDEWVVTRNGAGAAFKNWKNRSGTPEHVDFLMDSRAVWERDYRDLVKPDEARMSAEGCRDGLRRCRARGAWAFYGNLGVWECMRSSLGDVGMFENMLLDPDWILDFNRVYTRFFKGMYDLLFARAGVPDGVWVYDDLAYRNGLFCSPGLIEKLFAPFYRDLVDHLGEYGLPVVFHCCGGMGEALPIIADCGFAGLHPMERKAGCDPLAYARRFGDRLAFIGGLDAVTLEGGDRRRLFREADALMDGMGDLGAAYVLCSDHSLSPRVPYRDYRALVDRFWERAGR